MIAVARRRSLGDRSYDVVVGAGARARARRRAAAAARSGSPSSPRRHRRRRRPGRRAPRASRSATARTHKTLATVEDAVPRLRPAGASPAPTCVVAVGGGIVTDVAGFAAAVYHRGVAVVHVPTTLLGMVDAAIGGKTGVNLPEGKNLVGAFWQPAAVLCDTDAAGHAAAARVAQRAAARWPSTTSSPATTCSRSPTRRAHRRAASRIKAESWSARADERDGGRRAIAQLRPHARPTRSRSPARYDLRHGEAVAIGLVFAAELARGAGPHRRRRGSPSTAGSSRRLRPADRRCRPASTPTSWSR